MYTINRDPSNNSVYVCNNKTNIVDYWYEADVQKKIPFDYFILNNKVYILCVQSYTSNIDIVDVEKKACVGSFSCGLWKPEEIYIPRFNLVGSFRQYSTDGKLFDISMCLIKGATHQEHHNLRVLDLSNFDDIQERKIDFAAVNSRITIPELVEFEYRKTMVQLEIKTLNYVLLEKK